MNNGKETSKAVSEVAFVIDPFSSSEQWQDEKADIVDPVSPASSRYSSGGESEFERYCSANSVMGTPSMCSTITVFNDFPDSEYGSLKNLGYLDDSGLDNFSLEGSDKNRLSEKFLSNRENELGKIVIGGNSRVKYGSSGMELYDKEELNMLELDEVNHGGLSEIMSWKVESETDLVENLELDDDSDKGHAVNSGRESFLEGRPRSVSSDVGNRVENGNVSRAEICEINSLEGIGYGNVLEFEEGIEGSGPCKVSTTTNVDFDGLSFQPNLQYLERDEVREDEDDASSMYDNSRGEGSIYNCFSDDEGKDGTCSPMYMRYQSEAKIGNENPLLMNTSVAFGTDDWNDFMCETEGSTLHSLTSDMVHKKQEHLKSSNVTLIGSPNLKQTNKRENVREMHLTSKKGGREFINVDNDQVSENQGPGNVKVKMDPLSDVIISNKFSSSYESLGDKFREDHETTPQQSNVESKFVNISPNFSEDHIPPVETENPGQNELYDDVVNEMEEILLDSTESPGSRFSYGSKIFQSQKSLPLGNGRLTASTSFTNDAYLLIPSAPKIDEIEVVGARQKKGDVSFSERLVGVKEYTVYKIRVWSSTDQWEVERRYRDFYSLYYRLKSYFSGHGWSLPSPWLSVERESRKIFGNATPDVIAERSAIIQECLRSVLHSKLYSTLPNALIWFLSPEESSSGSFLSSSIMPNSSLIARGEDVQSFPTLGKTISLIVEIQPYKSIKQMLEAQHYVCAGCHILFDEGKTLMQGFVHKFGWGKPRLCEYTGQLFCPSCHTNDDAVIPARVLHHWDFYRYPVSQLAKSYLDSIHEQPMLCVSAVNPFLFSKVPALLHVMSIRKKIRAMLPYVRCPFRNSINIGLGNRRYLLESNDFFALRDLIDFSKGAFAALPVMVETVSRKILDHIMEQCLVCCDVGDPCGARQACNDSSALIFPFQEDEVEKCKSCELVFHKPCFGKLTVCPCGARLRVNHGNETSANANGSLGPKSNSPLGFLSGLFAKSMPDIVEPPDSDQVILMGTLPSTVL